MLYCMEIMDRICIDMLPFGKDVNLLISSFITTSDHISSILIKKINTTEKLIYTTMKTHHTSSASLQDLINGPQGINMTWFINYHIQTIEDTNKQLKRYINQLRKFKYTQDKGGNFNFNYYKLKSKLHIKEEETEAETEADQKYFDYLFEKY
jgi:hypothetical protein